jgi:hypothetical protein
VSNSSFVHLASGLWMIHQMGVFGAKQQKHVSYDHRPNETLTHGVCICSACFRRIRNGLGVRIVLVCSRARVLQDLVAQHGVEVISPSPAPSNTSFKTHLPAWNKRLWAMRHTAPITCHRHFEKVWYSTRRVTHVYCVCDRALRLLGNVRARVPRSFLLTWKDQQDSREMMHCDNRNPQHLWLGIAPHDTTRA